MTQPPWLHQFRFRWASAHPVIEPSHKGWITLLFLAQIQFYLFLVPPMDLSCSQNYLVQKNILIDSAPLSIFRVFFSKLFSFSHHCCHKLKEHGHRSSSLLMFKEEHRVVVTWRSKQHEVQHLQEDMETRYDSYIFFYI